MKQVATILVVDDDPDIRWTFNEFLSQRGYTVVEASNGEEALNLLDRIPQPSMIFLDLNMPVMNGYRFYASIRKFPGMATVPIVISSNDPYGRDIADALGAAGYVYKLLSPEAVLDIIAKSFSGGGNV